MPKVSIYLPDALYAAARAEDLPLSALTQQAIESALHDRANGAWIARASGRKPRTTKQFDSAALLGEVRDEFGA
ncbi:MAG: type II toxin-antitoxin system CcdA family antitoxin [Nocardioidaceae bacterium]